MTCIQFFQTGATNYSTLFDRLHHLKKAKTHLKDILDENKWVMIKRPIRDTSSGTPEWTSSSSESAIRLVLSPSELTK